MKNQEHRPPRARTIPCPTCGELFSSHGIHLHRERCASKPAQVERADEKQDPAQEAERDQDSGGFIFRR